jgi:hypothetical protein
VKHKDDEEDHDGVREGRSDMVMKGNKRKREKEERRGDRHQDQ